jgi:hypothetical protein
MAVVGKDKKVNPLAKTKCSGTENRAPKYFGSIRTESLRGRSIGILRGVSKGVEDSCRPTTLH